MEDKTEPALSHTEKNYEKVRNNDPHDATHAHARSHVGWGAGTG